MGNSGTNLMTEGKISSKIIQFALPIFWGNLFQQLYSLVDGLVVGNFVGMEALAAISSTGSLTFLIIGLFNGIFMGSSVVISKYFGAGDDEKVSKAIHTDIGFALICGVLMTLLGIFVAPSILRLMKTPDEIFDLANQYLTLHFAGIMTIALYNTASGIFQAVGDSKHPLYYLIISSVSNIVLDVLFVGVFHWGVAGAAVATIIAQLLSVILSFWKLMHIDAVHKVSLGKICLDKEILKEIIGIGLPSGVQNSVIGFANVIVQANINIFGAAAVAGYGASARLEGFVFIPITSLALAMSTYEGQNLGARNYERAKKGADFGIISSIVLAETIGIITFILAPQLIELFTTDPDAVAVGALKNRTTALFYFALALSHCFAGILRGAGKSKVPMFVMLGTWCIFRVLYIEIATYFIKDIVVVFWAYPITWIMSTVIFFIYYLKSDWLHGFEKHTR
ncbi:MAG: MATE family efflux transporter [Sphaerochaetaceae bacterium]|jgi:putative MATE family efflux protein|nr:MATE family efflux transporter [Sphaerochaetaceae bacterium]MDD3162845.1 MATE family efflux transporter [Sphaerochaetaceae bacterium]MDD4007158.1 MATE family efflux transporter [Sphaerochaetaceae bacterium]MDD4397834.1 MATE family efflux transporter [Sphaerochaetaceae bacterium]